MNRGQHQHPQQLQDQQYSQQQYHQQQQYIQQQQQQQQHYQQQQQQQSYQPQHHPSQKQYQNQQQQTQYNNQHYHQQQQQQQHNQPQPQQQRQYYTQPPVRTPVPTWSPQQNDFLMHENSTVPKFKNPKTHPYFSDVIPHFQDLPQAAVSKQTLSDKWRDQTVITNTVPLSKENGLIFSATTITGSRPHQEDRLVIAPSLLNGELSFFAVFDGTTGDYASEWLRTNILSVLVSLSECGLLQDLTSYQKKDPVLVQGILDSLVKNLYATADALLQQYCYEKSVIMQQQRNDDHYRYDYSASTAVIAIYYKPSSTMVVSHVADSHASVVVPNNDNNKHLLFPYENAYKNQGGDFARFSVTKLHDPNNMTPNQIIKNFSYVQFPFDRWGQVGMTHGPTLNDFSYSFGRLAGQNYLLYYGFRLTKSHKPDEEEELKRIIKAGGTLQYLHDHKPFIRGKDFRLKKKAIQLNYSRAFGSKDLKHSGLSAEPDICFLHIQSTPDCWVLDEDNDEDDKNLKQLNNNKNISLNNNNTNTTPDSTRSQLTQHTTNATTLCGGDESINSGVSDEVGIMGDVDDSINQNNNTTSPSGSLGSLQNNQSLNTTGSDQNGNPTSSSSKMTPQSDEIQHHKIHNSTTNQGEVDDMKWDKGMDQDDTHNNNNKQQTSNIPYPPINDYDDDQIPIIPGVEMPLHTGAVTGLMPDPHNLYSPSMPVTGLSPIGGGNNISCPSMSKIDDEDSDTGSNPTNQPPQQLHQFIDETDESTFINPGDVEDSSLFKQQFPAIAQQQLQHLQAAAAASINTLAVTSNTANVNDAMSDIQNGQNDNNNNNEQQKEIIQQQEPQEYEKYSTDFLYQKFVYRTVTNEHGDIAGFTLPPVQNVCHPADLSLIDHYPQTRMLSYNNMVSPLSPDHRRDQMRQRHVESNQANINHRQEVRALVIGSDGVYDVLEAPELAHIAMFQLNAIVGEKLNTETCYAHIPPGKTEDFLATHYSVLKPLKGKNTISIYPDFIAYTEWTHAPWNYSPSDAIVAQALFQHEIKRTGDNVTCLVVFF